jgi:type I restriction enzyme M protein
MGLIFENLIRRFNELANETAGDHFTPREVIRLMVNILFINDDQLLATPGTVRKLLDPACGTGGMLAESQNYLREHHSAARLFVYGQDYNNRAFATAASDMLMKQVDHNGGVDNVRFGDSFTDDQFAGETFDYLLANPPFGVDWKKQQKDIQREHDKLGFAGRFGAGLPRVNDGSLLFLQHMISKFEPVLPDQHKHGSRLAIVFSGSPLFTGSAGSGESDIRKWIIENDWLEAIIALPEQMFYNTGIGTYVWIVTNRKERRRKGKIQLLDAREFYVPMRRSLGDKRRKIGEKEDGRDQIAAIVQLYGRFSDGDTSKIFDNADFGYTRVTVELPLRLRYQMTVEDKARFLDACPHLLDDVQAIDKALGRELQFDWNTVWAQIGELLLHKHKSRWKAPEQKLFRNVFTQKDPEAEPVRPPSPNGSGGPRKTLPLPLGEGWGEGAALAYEPDPDLRDFENVALKDDIDTYFEREVRPHVPDAWMDRSKDKVGYEINFNRHFYRYTPPRPLEEIDAELKQAEEEIMRLLREVTE